MNSENLKADTSNTLYKYCDSLTEYSRRKTVQVNIGDVWLGSDFPIRIQSMTTVDTMDTIGSVEQTIRMVDAGCEYVRITAPSIKEAENLANIKAELRKRGYNVPLIADIHFTPNAAEVAARIVEKVRVNPGNYADKKRFETIDYTDASYAEELDRIRERFIPLIKICKEYGTAMRIGTNHGSLSDRILSRYGDTPLGMVESALEFLRICEDFNYYNTVISMKASNTQVMVQAYRLLVQKLNEEGLKPYPLHLGVTEAGEGEDGRIKSAVGIGTLLEDGLGDTIRVSLTEDPEFEVPVAKALAERYYSRPGHKFIKPVEISPINPFQHFRRKTREVMNFGGHNVPRVIMDLSRVSDLEMKDLRNVGHFYLPEPDKWKMNDLGCDYIFSGDEEIPFMLPNGVKEILNYEAWQNAKDLNNKFPLIDWEVYISSHALHHQLNFIRINYKALQNDFYKKVVKDETAVLVIDTHNEHAMPALRRIFFYLMEHNITSPVIVLRKYKELSEDKLQLYAATDVGGLLIDGLGDGILLSTELIHRSKEELLSVLKIYNNASFGILQAARTRMSKTEYISCPSCGRTLFDLQETTAMIRKRTDHLKGVKIGIMGCIVNGPGEMADADYGYVGVGKGKIALYRGQNVVKKFVSSDNAVDELINLIKEDGVWKEPEEIESN
jgi:(E)-4-hydroxy-3-methylbut-2-enyl-diphosphate synthase